jgi:hypothetical protein
MSLSTSSTKVNIHNKNEDLVQISKNWDGSISTSRTSTSTSTSHLYNHNVYYSHHKKDSDSEISDFSEGHEEGHLEESSNKQDPFDQMIIDDQMKCIKEALLGSANSVQDDGSGVLNCSLLSRLFSIHVFDKPENAPTLTQISKIVWTKKGKNIPNMVLNILSHSQLLLRNSPVTSKVQELIRSLSKPGKNKTLWIHAIVVNNFLKSIIIKSPDKDTSLKGTTIANRIKVLMDAMHVVFPYSNLKAPPFAITQEIQQQYQLFMEALGPVTKEEFHVLLTQKISFKEAVDDPRLCVDMKDKLSKAHQDELFVFVEKLKQTKTKSELKKLVKESAINITGTDREDLFKTISQHYNDKEKNHDILIASMVDLISTRISTMWKGMAYDYLMCNKQE